MNVSRMLAFVFVYFGIAVLATSHAGPAGESEQPNVVIIFSDDHRYSGVGANGCQQIKTPNIDRLAKSGMAFDHAYLMGSFSGATCIPSRAMLLSGRGLFQLQDLGKVVPEYHITIGQAFQRAGYYTHIVGKWHQDNASLARSFDTGGRMMSRGVYLTDHFRMPFWDWRSDGAYRKSDGYLLSYDKQRNVAKRPLTGQEKKGPLGTEEHGPHTTEIWTDEAVDFISSYIKDQPFFMYLAYHAPHDPRQAPEKFRQMYDPDDIELPPSFMTQHPFDNGDCMTRDERLAPFPRTVSDTKQQLADYYAIISHMDHHIGRVLAALDKQGFTDNTIIVFAGDSGLAVGCHGLFGKQSLYNEDGIHVPLLLTGPNVPSGKRSQALCYTHDIYPTLCQAAGVEIPESVHGKSLVPVIKDTSRSHRESLYHAYRQYQRAYRKGDYKLIEYVKAPSERIGGEKVGSRVTQLFNMKEDFWEINNLAYSRDKQVRELLAQMRTEMRTVAQQVGDTTDRTAAKVDFWDYYD